MTLAEELVSNNQAAVESEKTDLFGAIAATGELFFAALMSILHMLAAVGKRVGAAAYRGWLYLKKLLFKALDAVADMAIMPVIRYTKAFRINRAKIRRSKDEKGFIGGAAAGAKVAGGVIFGKRGIAVTLVNWALPIASCIALFSIISYTNSQTYALKLTVNGDFIGYISDETIFSSAEQMVQKRINYTGSNTNVITFEPTYEVDMIGYGTTLNTYQVTDKILGLLYADISEGYGLYIGDAYYGTLTSHNRVDEVLDSLLDQYRTDNPKESVAFEKEISFISGKYMNDSFTGEEDVISLLTSKKQVASYYTVQDGDSAGLIADKVNMTVEEIALLNEGFSLTYPVYGGQQIQIAQEEPYLNIVITREEHYNEPIQYETTYHDNFNYFTGDNYIQKQGVNGERAVVANVSYINGVEISRNVLSRTVITEPVTQIVSRGVLARPTNSGPSTTIPQGKFAWPVGGSGGQVSELPASYGGYYGHKGIDIAAPYGTHIYSGQSGVVVDVVWSNVGYGNHVVIKHDNGLTVTYGHMSQISSSIYEGKRVAANEIIGYVGSTGNSTGNHLHFEIRNAYGTFLDPLDYLDVWSHPWQAEPLSYPKARAKRLEVLGY